MLLAKLSSANGDALSRAAATPAVATATAFSWSTILDDKATVSSWGGR
jgi:hypothetical protein